MANARPKNSRDWVQRHLSDPYVIRANEEGFRSRSVYKLTEIDDKERLLKPGITVVDLGSAPGGWSQLAVQKLRPDLHPSSKIIAIDILEMDPITGVHFIKGDFSSQQGRDAVVAAVSPDGKVGHVDLVISDMAPNMSGIPTTDQARMFHLGEIAMDFAIEFLKPNGVFIVKVFQGTGFEPFVKLLRQNFVKVATKKPGASRNESRESYLFGRGVKIKSPDVKLD
jgi:23S rRNA (uridine2552-2'-O)-methyltransferase